MSWTLTDERSRVVEGPFATAHDALTSRSTCPYVRLRTTAEGLMELDAGFSALDHEHFRLVEHAAHAAHVL